MIMSYKHPPSPEIIEKLMQNKIKQTLQNYIIFWKTDF